MDGITHMSTFNPEHIKKDFPILSTKMNGQPLVFLDTAASSQKPKMVIDSISNTYETCYANVHRGIYDLSQEATRRYEEGRAKAAKFINAPTDCLILGRGATELINLVAQTYAKAFIGEGDEIVITEIEHHANIVPWQMLCEEKGCVLKVVPVRDNGEITIEDFKATLSSKTKLTAFPHISNALGTLLPVKEMVAAAHAVGAVTLIDGCQAVPRIPVDVVGLDTDFYVFSAHKMYGPTGIGGLYGRVGFLDKMPPWQGGGDMIDRVTFEKTTYAAPPARFEAGTPAIAEGIALGATVDYLNQFDMAEIAKHEEELTAYAEAQLTQVPGVKIIGTAPEKIGVVSFIVDGTHANDIGMILDEQGIAVRTGHHCAQPTMDRFGVGSTVRASFGIYTTEADVDALVAATHKAVRIFAK